MPTFIALLRGINVGGNNLIPMADLRTLAESIGLQSPRTLLQSGNLVFESPKTASALERLLESETKKRFGFAVDFTLRTADQWRAIIAANPFPKEAKSDPSHTVVMLLKSAPKPADVKALQAAIPGREQIRADGNQLYAIYPDAIGPSKLTNALIERKLTVRGTARNWNTVLKLAALTEK